ncbi:hypothetical protein [Roseivirga seohaensis]|uniref:Beta-lactamase-inhibitor-like PepSY-like domain-containing protein n=2 Tax=Roseivirga seohaensis TaxID=1914963 RepID=A0A0L8AI87_9BACT|nr:hypothetical protein [Roseivirga seohaensis]KOF01982.1 hypothetical protein OB69_14695 [Roseivirga seohaensis subsp. aquiponti]KYG83106.1 hypothetical protein AWW67_06690 [Roseivirga seohaensis]|tara:strand:- start:49 stop:384 length:336 start_codon:yes stop_codon:yes gene_type:complete
MKKAILSLLAIGTLSFTSVAFTSVGEAATVLVQQEKKTEILMKNLPEEVKKGWEEAEYKDENVEKIYKVETPAPESEEYIEFIVKKETGKVAVHFGMDGTLLREVAIDGKQ